MIIGIIAEYNPFHNGHLYQLQKVRKENKNTKIVVCMSSSFVQRGEPAVIDKWSRAKFAVEHGADLVLELPALFSTQNGEIFAKGGVGILGSFIDALSFGAEDDINVLSEINEKIKNNLDNDAVKSYLDLGYSLPVAKEMAMDFLTDEEKNILRTPNNILSMSYLNARDEMEFTFDLMSHSRKNVGYHESYKGSFASATYLRQVIKEDVSTTKNFVPESVYNVLNTSKCNSLENYFEIFKYKLIKESVELKKVIDYEHGMENRFLNYIDAESFEDFIDLCSTKRYSKARIRRAALSFILDLDKELIFDSIGVPYLRVLASNDAGFDIIREMKKTHMVIDKFSKIDELEDEKIKAIAKKEVSATDLYNIFYNKKVGEDFTHSPEILL